MKAILGGLVAALLISATAAPTFAASTSDVNNCVFKDSSLCATESLSPTTNEDAPAPIFS
jgi:archaellum component FlaG (FlaF/FlaG flagellin family)